MLCQGPACIVLQSGNMQFPILATDSNQLDWQCKCLFMNLQVLMLFLFFLVFVISYNADDFSINKCLEKLFVLEAASLI